MSTGLRGPDCVRNLSPSTTVSSPKGLIKSENTPSPKKQKLLRMNLDVPHPAPNRWKEVYSAIQEMRELYIAPVDTMGCDKAQVPETDPKVSIFLVILFQVL